MTFINIEKLNERLPDIKSKFQSQKPFRFVMFEDFFDNDVAELIHQNFPSIADGKWDGTTYLDQKNKFQKTNFEKNSILDQLFKAFNSEEFLNWLQKLTDFDEHLKGDSELFGGGLHQSINGAHLNVHVDYNYHPKTKYHRRLNVLVYMNQDWKEEYEGHLELWDFTDSKKNQLGKFAPNFNRCVIFETNEISFHGHPKPLKTPEGVNRKSLALYYYTETRPESEISGEHNTIYVNTEGFAGRINRLKNGLKALKERAFK